MNWNIGNNLFSLLSSNCCHKKLLLELLTIPLSGVVKVLKVALEHNIIPIWIKGRFFLEHWLNKIILNDKLSYLVTAKIYINNVISLNYVLNSKWWPSGIKRTVIWKHRFFFHFTLIIMINTILKKCKSDCCRVCVNIGLS